MSPQVFHILTSLADEDRHGYAIMQDVAERTNGKLRLSPGTLYGSIKRLLEQGLITEIHERAFERRRNYHLTPLGRKTLKAEVTQMAEMLEQARQHGFASKSLAPKRA